MPPLGDIIGQIRRVCVETQGGHMNAG
jgi:hypothetical protein